MTEAITEENKDKLKIRLQVYDTDIQLRIVREEEKLYRDAAKLITMTVNKYADKFKGLKTGKAFRNDTEPYKNILGKLTSEIEEAFGKQETENMIKNTI